MTKQYDNFADLITFTRASTGTYLDSDGLLKTATTNTPRIEYDASGNRKGLLIEEARTNVTITSEDFSVNWFLGRPGTSVSHGGVADPAGGTSASTFTYTGINNTQGILDDLASGVGNTTYTFSIWLKSATLSQARLLLKNASSDVIKAEKVVSLSTEWQRFDVTGTTDGASAGARIEFTTNGVAGSMSIWGAQLEAGSFPTSYIPTAGSTATRSADVASIPTSAFGYNADKGTVVCEFETQFGTPTGFPRIWEIGGATSGVDRVYGFINAASSQIRCGVLANGVTAADFSVKTDPTPASGKLAFAFADDDFAGVIDGGSPVTDTAGSLTTPSIPRNTLKFGGAVGTGASNMSGHIKSIQYYPRRLTNAQIVRLTS
jgi:hypothetical protein